MISFQENNNKFNFRVSAIILDPSQKLVLIHKIKGRDFWLLPGGRMEMNESTETGISRELKEELGIQTKKKKLVIISENFFHFNQQSYHELGFSYLITLPKSSSLLKKEGIFEGIEGEKYLFKWHRIDKLKELDFQPHFLVKEIENIQKINKIKQIIVDEKLEKTK